LFTDDRGIRNGDEIDEATHEQRTIRREAESDD
jgi:hypothetical protein